MKDPAWIAAFFAVLALFLGIGWLFMAMIAVFVSLIAAGSVNKHAASHGHGHGHGHDSHGHDSHGHGGHDTHAAHSEPKPPTGGFLDVMLGQAMYNKRFNKPPAKEQPKHEHEHKHEHKHSLAESIKHALHPHPEPGSLAETISKNPPHALTKGSAKQKEEKHDEHH